MNWERAEDATVDPDAYYVVQDNGWRGRDLCILAGVLVTHRLKNVRGRPEWIAKVVRPAVTAGD